MFAHQGEVAQIHQRVSLSDNPMNRFCDLRTEHIGNLATWYAQGAVQTSQ